MNCKVASMRALSRRRNAGLTLVEIMVLLLVVFVLVTMIPFPRYSKAKAGRIKCVNNMKNLGLAFRISTDSSDWFPQQQMMSNGLPMEAIDVVMVFGALSNEIGDLKILVCPEDKTRAVAKSFTNLTMKNISYFASLSAEVTLPQAFLGGDRNMATNGVAVGTGLIALSTNSPVSWTKEIHNEQGDILMADGSVMQMSSSRLKQSLRDQDLATNYLVFP